MQTAIAESIKEKICQKIAESSYISLLLDESNDISVLKKLIVYIKVISKDMKPQTIFLGNIQIADGKAHSIIEKIKQLLVEFNIPHSQVIGLRSDGAAVMMGEKNGVAGLMKQQSNPFLQNVHCIAHRLALVTSQAAKEVPDLKTYSTILSNLYYHFQGSYSAVRSAK